MKKAAMVLAVAAAMLMSGRAMAESVVIHDPSIIKDEGKYYVFGSHITAARSDDMINWKVFTNGYKETDNVIFGNLAENLAGSFAWAGSHDTDCKDGYAVWAPDVYYNKDYVCEDGTKGAYVMYYSTSSTFKRSCIGMAVSENVEGPYKYVDTIVYSGFTKFDAYDPDSRVNKNYVNTNIDELIESGVISGYNDNWGINDYNSNNVPNCIDPCIYDGADGSLWMVYGSWSGGIYTLELDRASGKPKYPGKDAMSQDRYFGTKIAGGRGMSGEGPFIYYDEEAGYYFLQDTYEWLGADGGYHIRMFRSKSPNGPFVDALGHSALYGANALDYQGVKLFGNFCFEEMAKAYKSGGHCSTLIDDDGERYLFYHTRFSDSGEYFELRVRQLFLNEDNWPVTAPYPYRGDKIEESYSISEVLGYYQFIDHMTETGVGNTYKIPLSVELTEDGRVRGAKSGEWHMNGRYITLKLADEVYKGVLFRQRNERGETVMTFSALNGNSAVWASKTEKKEVSPYKEFSFENTLNGAEPVAYPKKGQNPQTIDKEINFTDGVGGKAVVFDKTFGLRLCEVLKLDSYAVETWVKAENFSQYGSIISASKDFLGGKWLSLTTLGDNDASYIWTRREDLGIWDSCYKENVFKKGEWMHIILSVDEGTAPMENHVKASLYVNGVKVSEGEAAKGILSEGGSIYLGVNAWDDYFDGCMSDVKIYDHAIGVGEAAQIYETALEKAGLRLD